MVREFVGHGIGRDMHEDPKVPNFVTAEQLRDGFFAAAGDDAGGGADGRDGAAGCGTLSRRMDGVRRMDHMPAAHFEHTVAVTATGADVLTDGRIPLAATGT